MKHERVWRVVPWVCLLLCMVYIGRQEQRLALVDKRLDKLDEQIVDLARVDKLGSEIDALLGSWISQIHKALVGESAESSGGTESAAKSAGKDRFEDLKQFLEESSSSGAKPAEK